MIYDDVIDVLHKVFDYNVSGGFEAIWRQSQGDRDKALEIVQETAKHYDETIVIDANDMDYYLGIWFNDGVEIEWLS